MTPDDVPLIMFGFLAGVFMIGGGVLAVCAGLFAPMAMGHYISPAPPCRRLR